MEGHYKKVPRRKFLAALTAGLVTGGLPGCAALNTYPGQLNGSRIVLQLSELGEDIALGNTVLVRGPGIDDAILLRRDANGFFKALSSTCTHLGCQVRPARNFLTCPCHGSTFDLRGQVVRGPAQKPLANFPVELKGGQIEILI